MALLYVFDTKTNDDERLKELLGRVGASSPIDDVELSQDQDVPGLLKVLRHAAPRNSLLPRLLGQLRLCGDQVITPQPDLAEGIADKLRIAGMPYSYGTAEAPNDFLQRRHISRIRITDPELEYHGPQPPVRVE